MTSTLVTMGSSSSQQIPGPRQAQPRLCCPGDRHRSTSSSSQGESGGQQGWRTKAALVSSLPSPGDRAERNSGLWLGSRHSWIQASEQGTFAGMWTSLTFSFNIESAARCQVGEAAFLARPYALPSGWGRHLSDLLLPREQY